MSKRVPGLKELLQAASLDAYIPTADSPLGCKGVLTCTDSFCRMCDVESRFPHEGYLPHLQQLGYNSHDQRKRTVWQSPGGVSKLELLIYQRFWRLRSPSQMPWVVGHWKVYGVKVC